jgi:hypothetical protein
LNNFLANGSLQKHPTEIGNIILLATEQMEPSDNEQNDNDIDSGGGTVVNSTNSNKMSTDEELTPLHWLHDKNLLKGWFHI